MSGPPEGYTIDLRTWREEQGNLRASVQARKISRKRGTMTSQHSVDDLYSANGITEYYDNENALWIRDDVTDARDLPKWRCPARNLTKPVGPGHHTEYGPFTTERKERLMARPLVTTASRAKLKLLENLQSQVAELSEELEGFTPQEPAGLNTVVRFRKYRAQYSFAAIKVGTSWYLTQDGSRSSRQGHAPKTWDELLEFIGDRNWASVEVLG
jgi:hypothetical protein